MDFLEGLDKETVVVAEDTEVLLFGRSKEAVAFGVEEALAAVCDLGLRPRETRLEPGVVGVLVGVEVGVPLSVLAGVFTEVRNGEGLGVAELLLGEGRARVALRLRVCSDEAP